MVIVIVFTIYVSVVLSKLFQGILWKLVCS